MLRPSTTSNDYLHTAMGRKSLKEARRQRRRLAERGAVTWAVRQDSASSTSRAIETFLKLENSGWKGTKGTAMAADPLSCDFAREMLGNFARSGRLLIGETLLDGTPIASSVNLVTRDKAFAFKIGWQAEYARFGPGILNEISFVDYVCNTGCGISEVDSGATQGSFIESLWSERSTLSTLTVPTTNRGTLHCAGLRLGRTINGLFRRKARTSKTPR